MKKLTKKEKTTITRLRLGEDDWYLVINSVRDGYILETSDGDLISIRDKDDDETIQADGELLWEVIDYFNMRFSRYEKEVLSVIKEVGDKYGLKANEKLARKYYEVVQKK